MPDNAKLHDQLGAAVDAVYAAAGDAAGLSEAIKVLQRGLRQGPTGDPNRGIFLAVLGMAFGFRFELTNDLGDIESAVAFGEQAIAVLPADDPQRGKLLWRLSDHYAMHYEAVGTPSDLDAVVELCGQAMAEAPATPALLDRLAYTHQLRADLGEAPDDVDAQIAYAERGLAIADAADYHRPRLYVLAAAGYERRYERADDIGDLDTAITYREAAVEDDLRDHAMRVRNLSNLSFDYLERHCVNGDPADVRSAVDRGSKALEIAGGENPDYAELLHKLGLAYRARFKLVGNVADLNEYVDLTKESRRCAPTDYQGTALVSLATAHAELHDHTRDHRDLDVSIEISEEALAHPGLNKRQRSSCVANLAEIYRKRFQLFGVQGDLDYSLQLGHRAIRTLPDGQPELASALENLADSYVERFKRDMDKADLETAVELCERALAIPGISHAARLHLQSHLATLLLVRFQADGEPADLDASIERSELALGAIEKNDRRWPAFAESLAGALLHRHRFRARAANELGNTDLGTTIDLIERVVAATRPDSEFFLVRLHNLAVAYQEHAADPQRRVEIVRQLVGAVGTAAGATPTVLASMHTDIGRLALQAGLLTEAAAMWRKAVELLPRCAPHGMAWSDQEHLLSDSGGPIAEATATHLAIGDVAGAVELAELGRGVLLSNQLDARIDLTALSRSAPDLAEEFKRLVAEMDTRLRIDERLHDLAGGSALRRPPRHLADRWDQLLHRIRQLPEFSDFLTPPRIAELQRAATEGAVVLVNVGTLGGDAVVIKPDSVVRVRLPKLTEADAEAHANALAGVEFFRNNPITRAKISRAQGATHDLLAWLWETVTEPVLTALEHDIPPAGRPMPRVWWMATGNLSLLPLHAAGLPDGPSALDHVVSSYTPTIRALTLGRQRGSPDSRTQLTVTMRHTEGLPDMPATAVETAHLLARNPNALALADKGATTDAVLDALPRASWVHFSCHATSHPQAGSKSGLHLHDRMLRVPEISRIGLRGGELAYLSACSTGQGSLLQADEATHLASAFQLAGYRHVIATLWPVNNQVAAMAARRFYRLLGDSPAADGAAMALHEATQRLRKRFPDNPELWAPFVHSGP